MGGGGGGGSVLFTYSYPVKYVSTYLFILFVAVKLSTDERRGCLLVA